MKKKLLGVMMMTTAMAVGVGLLSTDSANAHGYVKEPASRGYKGKLEKDLPGSNFNFLMEKYGAVITNPQSLEFTKGFPQVGPPDGRIASANGGLGQIPDSIMDETGANRWDKEEISTGLNTFLWEYTAFHGTTKWHYYMTKIGWNPEKPLARDSFELIGEVKHDGSDSKNNSPHQITVPSDRSGYHVILAVWDVSNTANAFYNVIDVNVKNGGHITPPITETIATPKNVRASEITTSSLQLNWDKENNAKEYNVYRDNIKIGTVSTNQFNDTKLKETTTYSYQVEAVSHNGKVSAKSAVVTATTQSSQVEDTQKPAAPTNVHSMETTKNSVDLMWTKSTHFLGIKNYEVYRDGKKVATTEKTSFKDSGLKANTTYKYTVKAISLGGNTSDISPEFSVKTKEAGNQKTSWESEKIYSKGDTVFFDDLEYEAKHWTKGDQPDKSNAWKLLSESTTMWNADKEYSAGETVIFQGKTYKAQWSTKNVQPGTSSAWALL